MTDVGATRPSPLEAAVARAGDRWSLLLIDALLDRPQRFNELQEAVAGISTNVLSARLKHLETERLVVAWPYQDRPVRHAYELTASGRDLGWRPAPARAVGRRPGGRPRHRGRARPLRHPARGPLVLPHV